MGNKADAANDPGILRLENLDTDIEPPIEALQTTRDGVGMDGNNSYLPFFGLDCMRQAATKRIQRVSGIEYDWKSECIVTAGGLSGIFNCLLATVEPGDEVIVTDPTYAGIVNRIHLTGATPVYVALNATEDGWRLDLEALQNAVSDKTKLVIANPCMPHGHVFNMVEWEAIAKICKEKNIYLLYDAAMERILYDGRMVIHPASLEGMADRTITVGTASKELRMIGWRVGWVVGPKAIMDDIGLVSISNVVCQTGISMAGVAAGLNAKDDGLKEACRIWEGRRDVLMEEFAGLPIVKPHGGWSFLINAKEMGYDASALSKRLFDEAKVAATPMTGWGPNAANYVRFVFSNEPEERLRGIGDKVRALC